MFVDTLLMTYRLVVSPERLLEKVLERFYAPRYVFELTGAALADKVASFLLMWLRNHFTGMPSPAGLAVEKAD